MKILSILLSLCLVLALLPSGSRALTVKREKTETTEDEVEKLMKVANKFIEMVPNLNGEDALGLAQLVETLKNDDETKMLLDHMRSGRDDQNLGLQEQIKNAQPNELLQGMINIYDELKAIDILFTDPKRAVEAVNDEGMIDDKKRLEAYRENPAVLEEDMRSGLYITFVYIAEAGGFF